MLCDYVIPNILLLLGLLPKEKPPMNVVGDVGGKIAIIVVRFLPKPSTFDF